MVTKNQPNKNKHLKNNKGATGNVKLKKQPVKKQPPQLPIEQNEDDVEFDEEDIEYFEENEQYAGFLSGLDPAKLTKVEKPKIRRVTDHQTKVPSPGLLSSSDEDDSDLDDDNIQNEEEDEQEVEQKMFDSSDEEQSYELKPRKAAEDWMRRDTFTRLPIKLPGGKIVRIKEVTVTKTSQKANDESNSAGKEEEKPQNKKDVRNPEESEGLPLSKKARILQIKETLAGLAQQIIEDPDANVGKLKKLRQISHDENIKVRKLAYLTQLAVYKDIIPGYRIRQLTEKEQQNKVTKEVKKLRNYENSLLSSYQAYLQDLEDEVKISTKQDTKRSDKITAEAEMVLTEESIGFLAVQCMCQLLTSLTHFNFRLNLMTSVIARMSTQKWSKVASICCKAIIEVFREDESGEASLDAVKLLTDMIKSKKFAVHENILGALLHLRLKDELSPLVIKEKEEKSKKRKKQEYHLSKKQRKIRKENKEVEKELRDAEAVVSREEKENNQTETLKLIFATYFRILKDHKDSPLLSPALEGLAKFSHLINVDFFRDLLEVLKSIIGYTNDDININEQFTSTGARRSLLCVITAFQLLSGQGEALNLDLRDFYTEMYTTLLPLALDPAIEETSSHLLQEESIKETGPVLDHTLTETGESLLVKGIEFMFLKRQKIPVDRTAAFIKRLSTACLNMPSNTVVTLLNVIKRLIQKTPRLDALLSSESIQGNGIYIPELDDPDLCNPFATSIWELHLLQSHFDPQVRAAASGLARFHSNVKNH